MEEKLEGALTDFIEMIKQGGEFAIDQAPLVVQELINWAIVSHSFYTLLGIVFGYFSIQAGRRLIKDMRKDRDNRKYQERSDRYKHIDVYNVTVEGMINNIVLIVGGVIGATLFFGNIYFLMQVLVAPRIYVINEITKLF